MIETHDLTKVYVDGGLIPFRRRHEEVLAVHGLNLRVEEGQILGLLGVNGAGKTTAVKMLCTLLEPTSGSATVGGYDVVRDANRVRRIVNMIAGGERMLYARLTGRENLSYFADLWDVDRKVKKRRIGDLLEMVGLTESADRRVEQYSKGMKQRLQIARGLINDPLYLFMDEPTIGLDAPIAREIRRIVKGLNKTILFTTHYMEEAEELCDAIAVMHRGEIVERGTSQELRSRYKKGHSLVVTVEGDEGHIERALEAFRERHRATISAKSVGRGYQFHIHTGREATSDLVDALVATSARILELRAVEPSLEDVLVAISGQEGR